MDDTTGSREGSQFGPYRLRRLLGRGGMGDVYEAEDTVRERIVALKLMSGTLSTDPVFRTRMRREARTAGRLQEPHVVPIHDFGEIDGQLYVDMRLIDGVDLASVLTHGPLSPPRAVAIVRQIGSALDAAHAAGVTHRDVKPENILVTQDDFAYLVDFGIASSATDEKLTQLGSAVGTVKYMAPERFGDFEVTSRADIYALTCVLYECLTGFAPYLGDQIAVMSGHLNQPIPLPSVVRPEVPASFDPVIAGGMAKNPAERYATCGDLSTAAYAALAAPDRDQASHILQRSLTAPLPPDLVSQAGTVPKPAAPTLTPNAMPPGPMWPTPAPVAPVAPGAQTQYSATAGWAADPTGGFGAPVWGQLPPPPVRRRRKPWLWAAAAVVVVLAVAGGTVTFIAHPWRSSPHAPPVELRVLDDGVFVGSSDAPRTIDIFNEPICPPCGSFIRSYASDIDTAVNNSQIAVRYHLLNFLDDKSPSQNYSTRAVAATYCVAEKGDPTIYTRFYTALFGSDFQPEEAASEDRTDAELARLAESAGAEPTMLDCIKQRDDLAIAKKKSELAYEKMSGLNATGTPFVASGGRAVNYEDPDWLRNLVD